MATLFNGFGGTRMDEFSVPKVKMPLCAVDGIPSLSARLPVCCGQYSNRIGSRDAASGWREVSIPSSATRGPGCFVRNPGSSKLACLATGWLRRPGLFRSRRTGLETKKATLPINASWQGSPQQRTNAKLYVAIGCCQMSTSRTLIEGDGGFSIAIKIRGHKPCAEAPRCLCLASR